MIYYINKKKVEEQNMTHNVRNENKKGEPENENDFKKTEKTKWGSLNL